MHVPGICSCFVSEASLRVMRNGKAFLHRLSWIDIFCVPHGTGSPGNSKDLQETQRISRKLKGRWITNIGTDSIGDFSTVTKYYACTFCCPVISESTANRLTDQYIIMNGKYHHSIYWLVGCYCWWLAFLGIPDKIYKSPEKCLGPKLNQPTNQPTNQLEPHNHQTCNCETYSLALCGRT